MNLFGNFYNISVVSIIVAVKVVDLFEKTGAKILRTDLDGAIIFRTDGKKLSRCMARIAHFCVGVEEEIYDFDTLYKLSHGYLDDTIYHKLLPMLKDKSANQQEDFYANFSNVVKRMKQK